MDLKKTPAKYAVILGHKVRKVRSYAEAERVRQKLQAEHYYHHEEVIKWAHIYTLLK